MAPRKDHRRGGAIIPALAVVALLALLFGGYSAFRAGAGGADGPSADHYQVTPISFDIAITASGELKAGTQTEIRNSIDTNTTIESIVPEGSRVKTGEVLIELASDEIEQKIDESLLKVESSKSDLIAAEQSYEIQLNENEAAIRQAKLKLELARIDLNKWLEGDQVKKIQELDVAIETADRNLKRLKDKFEKSSDLFDRGFLSKDEFELDRIKFLEAESTLSIARLNKRVFENYEKVKTSRKLNSDVEEAAAALERVKSQNTSRIASKEADRTNKRRQLSIRQERLAKLQEQLEATTLRAPTDGLVVYASTVERRRSYFNNQGPLAIGSVVSPNQLLMALPDTSEMIASVRAPESVAGRIHPGQEVRLRINAIQSAQFKGVVESVGVLAESGGWRDPNLREYTVKIRMPDANGAQQLKPSMRCEAEIVLGRVENAIAVPMQAVFREGPVSYVYTPSGSRFVRTPIAISKRRSSSFVEVLAGLSEGDQVLLREPDPGEVIDSEFDAAALAQLAAATPGRRSGRPGGAQGHRAAVGAGAHRSVKAVNAVDKSASTVKPASIGSGG